jgi:hypothetical protein
VKVEEKKLIYPDVDNVGSMNIFSLDQMLEKFTLEAIFKKEITRTINTRDITNLLLTIFFGGIISAHLNQQSPVKQYFRRNLDLLFKGLQ